jgi:hypothetical protein
VGTEDGEGAEFGAKRSSRRTGMREKVALTTTAIKCAIQLPSSFPSTPRFYFAERVSIQKYKLPRREQNEKQRLAV